MQSLDTDQLENYTHQIDQLTQTLREKDDEISRSEQHNQELEQKLQKLLMEFAQVRTKAQEMLVKKDQEIKKLKNIPEEKSGMDSESSDEDQDKKQSQD